jgi:hypothetical protein
MIDCVIGLWGNLFICIIPEGIIGGRFMPG